MIKKPKNIKDPIQSSWRVGVFVSAVIVFAGVIIFQLFSLTVTNHVKFAESAKSQYNNPTAMLDGRGNIYVSDLSVGTQTLAATNRTSLFVYTTGSISDSPNAVADKLSGIIKKDKPTLISKLSDKKYSVLASGIAKEQVDEIKKLKISGIATASQIDRYYTMGPAFSHVLGFVGFKGNQREGQYGIEGDYNEVLSGINKSQDVFGNATYSKIINLFKKPEEKTAQAGESADGNDLVLTIDKNIQAMVSSKLDDLLKKWDAAGGSIIVEDPTSGEILAMVASPSYDNNNYTDYPLKNFGNPNVQSLYEPGSSFKPVTMAAALDLGIITPETTYEDTGVYTLDGYTIRNFNEKANGIQTMRQVLEHSLNTGVIFVENKTGDDKFLNYVVSFGFGQKSGVDLGGEVSGNISNLYTGRKLNFATASFGQGIAATPLQVANAYSAIANGGRLMWPHLVKQIKHPDGSIENVQPKIIGNPIKETTALKLKSMLVDVVDKGFDKARIKGYDVAGKTGTAQIPSPDGGYLEDDQFIHNFVGFAPAYDPRFVVLIKMDKPKGIKFAADSLSPVFGDVARYLLNYFNIPPTRK